MTDKVKWFFDARSDPWSDKGQPDWKEYSPETTKTIEEALASNKPEADIGTYKIVFKSSVQVHKVDDFKRRPVTRSPSSIAKSYVKPSLRKERFDIKPSPVTGDCLKDPYSALIRQYCTETNITGTEKEIIQGGELSEDFMRKLTSDAAEGILEGGREDGKEISQLLYSYIRKKQDVIGKLCLQLYTSETFFYGDINKALKSQDYEKTTMLGPFCLLLFWFIQKCLSGHTDVPRYSEPVFRGAELNADMIKEYEAVRNQAKPYFGWEPFISTTKDRERAEALGNTLFVISFGENTSGVDLSDISAFRDEEEVLLNAKSQFSLDRIEERSGGKYIISITKKAFVRT